MATTHTTVFIPLIAENRANDYAPADFQIDTRPNDPGIDITFTPTRTEDQDVWMIAPGEVFYIPSGQTVQLSNGPEIVAPADKNVVAIHVISTYNWTPILSLTGQPVAEWWALEGIDQASFEAFVDGHDLGALAQARNTTEATYRSELLSGQASINVLLTNEQEVAIGALVPDDDGITTLGLRAWANYETGVSELQGLDALSSIKQLAPGLEDHPVIVQAITEVSTSDVTIHVRFVHWNPRLAVNAADENDKGGFVAVKDDSRIALQKRDAAGNYTTIVDALVPEDGNGQVALLVPRADLHAIDLAGGESLVFHVAHPATEQFETQYQHQWDTIQDPEPSPKEAADTMEWGGDVNAWKTYKRSTTDGAVTDLDFLVDLESAVVGTNEQPLEYYAGVPVFMQIQYPVVVIIGTGENADFGQEIRQAPKGLKVELLSSGVVLGTFYTDEHGQIWGQLLEGNEQGYELEIRIHYVMEDEHIGLLPFAGEVIEQGATITFYTSDSDYYTDEPFSPEWSARIGDPTASALAFVQVGTVEINNTQNVSRFDSENGRHAGMLHALQQIRYVHQWFFFLTDGFIRNFGEWSYATILSYHNGAPGTSTLGTYTVELPGVRIHEDFAEIYNHRTHETTLAETHFGSVEIERDNAPHQRWWLNLYGYDSFRMNQQLTDHNLTQNTRVSVDIPNENKVQFWRDHTIWHEFTHTVLNIALGRLFNLDTHAQFVNAKDPDTSSKINQPIADGWSVFEEAFAALAEVALTGKMTGITPAFTPSPTASPRYLQVTIDLNNDGTPDAFQRANQGLMMNNVLDWRAGLRIPMAFTWGLWTALKEIGGFEEAYTLLGGPPTGNDLRDALPYLQTSHSRRIFKALIWGPLIALSTPQAAGPPAQWDDLDGNNPGFVDGNPEGKGGAGPAFGDPGSRRIRINGPSTHRFMEVMVDEFWIQFTGVEKNTLRDLFGDVDDPTNFGDVSFYLWFDF